MLVYDKLLNPISDACNSYIEFARWTAPLVTTTEIPSLIRILWRNIIQWLQCLTKDSLAIYLDEEIKEKSKYYTSAIYSEK